MTHSGHTQLALLVGIAYIGSVRRRWRLGEARKAIEVEGTPPSAAPRNSFRTQKGCRLELVDCGPRLVAERHKQHGLRRAYSIGPRHLEMVARHIVGRNDE